MRAYLSVARFKKLLAADYEITVTLDRGCIGEITCWLADPRSKGYGAGFSLMNGDARQDRMQTSLRNLLKAQSMTLCISRARVRGSVP